MSAVLILDQLTKYLVTNYIPWHGTVRIIPGFFDLTNVRNPGAAFGILSGDHGVWRSVFFVGITLVALGVIAVLIRKAHERLLIVALSLVAGGAVGNLIDRIRYGEVVDFIEWYYKAYHWPTFNVADSAISVGVGLLVVDMFLKKPQPKENTKSDTGRPE
jgi:signal peptidase II